jgi:hypothetical protein
MSTRGSGPLPQGDPALLQTEQAQRLLRSSIPARVAYRGADGTPRVVATWFHWNGTELVMPTFVSAPHIVHPAQRIRALRAEPAVAVTIDTEDFPPVALTLRGRVTVTDVAGVVPEYADAARRYLGEDAAAGYLASLEHPTTQMARIALEPTWVGLIDFQTRLPSALGGITGDR